MFWPDALAYCAWKEKQLGVPLRLLTVEELREIHPFYSSRYEELAKHAHFYWENKPPRPLIEGDDERPRVDVPSALVWSEPRFGYPKGTTDQELSKRWIVDFPPKAQWADDLPCAEYAGLRFIDAWDAYEWCQEPEWIHGRFWEGYFARNSWGAYKNIKVSFRVAIDVKR